MYKKVQKNFHWYNFYVDFFNILLLVVFFNTMIILQRSEVSAPCGKINATEKTVANSYIVNNYIPRRKSGIYWIQVRRAAAAAAVEISLWTR